MLKQLEEFTCRTEPRVFGGRRPCEILAQEDGGEDVKLDSTSKVDLARLPPSHAALKPHLQRVNHRVALYKRTDESMLQKLKPYDG